MKRPFIYLPILLTLALLPAMGCREARMPEPLPRPQTAMWNLLMAAEQRAGPHGGRVLATGRRMTIEEREILRGGCWDYADAVFNRAGYPNFRRRIIFRNGRRGPYAPARIIRPGDWLYYINHSYGGVDHSGIFVEWLDAPRRRALILSYPGERRREPGRYRAYDLSAVFQVIRPVGP